MNTQSKLLGKLSSIAQSVDWDEVITAELPRIFNFFWYKVGNREVAQDLTATTFERAWRLRSRYRPLAASPTTWLFGFAKNVLKEYLRKSKRIELPLESLLEEQHLSFSPTVEVKVQSQLDKEFLHGLLRKLSEREQELIALKYGAGLTNREIAKITGFSESNVGTILHRTVSHLRKEWNDKHG